MFGAFREALTLPGALRFSAAGLLARMPLSVLGIGTVLFVQAETGSYGIAGAVAAAVTLANAIGSPVLARLVDRRGQARIMVPAAIVHVISLSGLTLAVYAGWHAALLVLLAVPTGASIGSVGSMVRARWTYAVTTPRQLDAAFSWEAMMDEVLFVLGPPLVTVLAITWLDSAGVLLSLAAVTIGSALFYAQRSTEPPIIVRGAESAGRVMSHPGIIVVVVVYLLLGIVFAVFDIATIAFAEEQGAKSMAGVVLGVFALGSLLAGLGYGAKNWVTSAATRLVVSYTLLAVGGFALLLPRDLVQLGFVAFLVGFAIAPTLISGSTVIRLIAPKERMTEAFAWSGTSLGVGVAAGSPIAGALIDVHGAHAALYLIAGTATLGTAIIWFGRGTLRRSTGRI